MSGFVHFIDAGQTHEICILVLLHNNLGLFGAIHAIEMLIVELATWMLFS